MVIGLAFSFIIVGVTISRFSTLLGLNGDQIKTVSAILLIATSLFFLSSHLQTFVSEKLTRLSKIGTESTSRWKLDESSGIDSVILGALLGVIWSPCAGPTLGVAVSLASQETGWTEALNIMAIYALGASIPMLLISYGLRSFFQKNQKLIMGFSEKSKTYFGAILIITGIFIFFGLDKSLETLLLDHLPEGWIDLITKY